MAKQRTGDELIVFDKMPIGYSLSDYWRWNASDLLNNTLRGSYCEFIVSSALDVDLSGVNEDWTPYDISSPTDGSRMVCGTMRYALSKKLCLSSGWAPAGRKAVEHHVQHPADCIMETHHRLCG